MRCAALLRAVNVAGRGRLPMADLRAIVADAGFTDVATVLQSGNVVFEAGKRAPAALETTLAAALARSGLVTDVFVRTAPALHEIVARNPFPDAARDDPSHLTVCVLSAAPAPAAVDALRARIVGRERIVAVDRELYAVYPDGIGDSKLTAAVIDRALAVRSTARNWNTIRKLVDAVG